MLKTLSLPHFKTISQVQGFLKAAQLFPHSLPRRDLVIRNSFWDQRPH